MLARTTTRVALALAFVLASLAAPAVVSAGQAPPPVAVATRVVCPGDQFEITITNPGVQTYQVVITSTFETGAPPEVVQVTIDPGETEQVLIAITGTPMEVSIDGDGDFPDQQTPPLFRCTQVVDLTATTPQDTPVVIDLRGPCATGADTPHGTVEQIDNFTIRYTPDPGFVGVDTFPYSCSTSAELEGSVTVTVTPAQAPPAEPVPEAPTFTG